MSVTAGQPFTVTLAGSGLLTDVGARLEHAITRDVAVEWVPAIADLTADLWTAGFDEAPPAGIYLLVWRDEATPPAFEIIDTLLVSPAAGAVDGGPPVWAPTLADIAAVSPAYTRGGFDDDSGGPHAGAEQATFTSSTSPSADHVTGLIAAACGEVAGRVGTTLPARCHPLAKACAIWHVAAAISAGKLPAGTDDAGGEYRSHITNYRASLDELILQARQATALRLT